MKIWSRMRYAPLNPKQLDPGVYDFETIMAIKEEIERAGSHPSIPVFQTSFKYRGKIKEYFIVLVGGAFSKSPNEREFTGEEFRKFAEDNLLLTSLGRLSLDTIFAMQWEDEIESAFCEVSPKEGERAIDKVFYAMRQSPNHMIIFVIGDHQNKLDGEILPYLNVQQYRNEEDHLTAVLHTINFRDERTTH